MAEHDRSAHSERQALLKAIHELMKKVEEAAKTASQRCHETRFDFCLEVEVMTVDGIFRPNISKFLGSLPKLCHKLNFYHNLPITPFSPHFLWPSHFLFTGRASPRPPGAEVFEVPKMAHRLETKGELEGWAGRGVTGGRGRPLKQSKRI